MGTYYSAAYCQKVALQSQNATETAKNVTTSDLITGGGTKYYLVEFDNTLDGHHYRIQVEAYSGNIVDTSEMVNGQVINRDENGNIIGSTAVE